MKIAVGADHRGSEIKSRIAEWLAREGHELTVIDGCDRTAPDADPTCDYPDIAFPVASAVASGTVERGILICGSGIGMSIAANKVGGVRAALVHDEVSADMSRRHNDANVICLPADMLGPRIIDRIVKTWLDTPFEGGRHERRVQKIAAIERGDSPSSVADNSSSAMAG